MVEDLEPMSEERLMELRKMRDDIKRQPYSDWGFSYQQDIADAVDEIDRLHARIEQVLEENLELKMKPVFDEYREYRA